MLLCFLLAATFWVLKALNKKYDNVRISYPVAFIYDQTRLVPVTEPPSEIVINVDGKGWKLLRKVLNLRIQPAAIHINNRAHLRFLTARQLRPLISTALSGLDLNYVVTDTIYFNFEPLATRTISLTLKDPDAALDSGYERISPVSISPEQVTVSGPVSLVNALPTPYPVHLSDSGISGNFNKQIRLAFMPENLLKPNVQEVAVRFDVVSLHKKEIYLGIGVRNRDSLRKPVAIIPNQVKLTFQVSAADSAIKANQFIVEADLARLNPQDSTVALKIMQKPSGIRSLSVSPQKVKVVPQLP